MTMIDVFNGDADGICALHQLRLTEPAESRLVTGVKRDVTLLSRVEAAAGDRVTVLDISLDRNRADLLRILGQGAAVTYIDHHFAGELPASDKLDALIDTSADVCTSLLVNRRLGGRHLAWAVAAAFGDNLFAAARQAAAPLALSEAQLAKLAELGTCLNYNGYGNSVGDLHFAPDDLYRELRSYTDPFAFIADATAYAVLRRGYADDMAHARAVRPEYADDAVAIYMLPDAPWARRSAGVLGNELARAAPGRAHALLTAMGEYYRVSVRAPVARPEGADTLCMKFPSGGGRKGAAGINELPATMLDTFIAAMRAAFGR